MELTNEFSVPVPVERAWEVLTDVELIAPCLPGAELQEIEGDEYRGIVKVKVGPITAQYKGAATFREQDVDNRRIVLEAQGRDTRGQGSASAVITATMIQVGDRTEVKVHSDVTIKGKVAQFGRGMIAEVSAKLLTQFVECLEGKLEGGPATTGDPTHDAAKAVADVSAASATAPGAIDEKPVETVGDPTAEQAKAAAKTGTADGEPTPAPDAPKVRKIDSTGEIAPVDLLDTAGAPIAKRFAPVFAVLFVLFVIGRRRRKS